MTQPLSPAAQAVLEAYRLASDGCYINGEWIQGYAGQVAAAIRAAADRTEAESIWRDHQEHTGVRWAAHQWRAIAAELEGHG